MIRTITIGTRTGTTIIRCFMAVDNEGVARLVAPNSFTSFGLNIQNVNISYKRDTGVTKTADFLVGSVFVSVQECNHFELLKYDSIVFVTCFSINFKF